MFIHRRQLLDAMTASAIWVMSCSVVNGVKRFWKIAEVQRRLWDSINLNRIWFSHQFQSWIFNHIQINALETLESLSSSTLTSEKACLLRGFHCWIWRGLLCTENRCPASPCFGSEVTWWVQVHIFLGDSDWFRLIRIECMKCRRQFEKFKQREPKATELIDGDKHWYVSIYTYLSLNSLTTPDRAQMRSMCKMCKASAKHAKNRVSEASYDFTCWRCWRHGSHLHFMFSGSFRFFRHVVPVPATGSGRRGSASPVRPSFVVFCIKSRIIQSLPSNLGEHAPTALKSEASLSSTTSSWGRNLHYSGPNSITGMNQGMRW